MIVSGRFRCTVGCEYRVLAAAPSLVPRRSPLLGQRNEVIVVRLGGSKKSHRELEEPVGHERVIVGLDCPCVESNFALRFFFGSGHL